VNWTTCRVRFNTHDVLGLSLNDFICAAKVDALIA
jgi:4a-hydroxytetrahydrobiopterin dehydratase